MADEPKKIDLRRFRYLTKGRRPWLSKMFVIELKPVPLQLGKATPNRIAQLSNGGWFDVTPGLNGGLTPTTKAQAEQYEQLPLIREDQAEGKTDEG